MSGGVSSKKCHVEIWGHWMILKISKPEFLLNTILSYTKF